jgi:hypothetical protein
MRSTLKKRPLTVLSRQVVLCAAIAIVTASRVLAQGGVPQIPPDSRLLTNDPTYFRPDPSYADKLYDAKAQLNIYGGEHNVPTTRPAIEWGRELFTAGPFAPESTYLGDKNPIYSHLWVYGDWRSVVAANNNGDKDNGAAVTRMDLDVDFQFTSTERFHMFFRPLDRFERNGQLAITSYDFGTGQNNAKLHLNGYPEALFFEGDLGRLADGISGRDTGFDLPVAGGLIPLLMQNGIWMQDAFTGGAFTIPARNSRIWKISNMDVTFFSGWDRVATGALPTEKNTPPLIHDAHIFGMSSFIEADQGYWEADYGYTSIPFGLSYHNISLAFTHRYWNLISSSIRGIGNVGQDPQANDPQKNPGGSPHKTANGGLILLENSLITSHEQTLVPYANFFAGFDSPQSLARAADAGQVLVNTGLNFETDGLTGFPDLDATGHNTYGGALGVEYLFNLNQQIVVEVASVQVLRDSIEEGLDKSADGKPIGSQYGFGVRYQLPLTKSWIFRTDGTAGHSEHDFVNNDVKTQLGIRVELRKKF